MSWISELFHKYEQGASYSIFKNSRVAEERMEMLKFRSGMKQGEKEISHGMPFTAMAFPHSQTTHKLLLAWT